MPMMAAFASHEHLDNAFNKNWSNGQLFPT